MKKFALKQSFEATFFPDLQGLVEAVIQHAHDSGGTWAAVTIDPKHVVAMAKGSARSRRRGRKITWRRRRWRQE